MTMNKLNLLRKLTHQTVLATILILGLHGAIVFAGDDDHGEEGHSDEVVTMSATTAMDNGITTVQVSPGELAVSTTLYGRISADPASLSHIRARFDGVIKTVNVNIGDKVKKGDVLAVVESNESLKTYSIASPFDGSVIARHANNGELSNGQVLFSLANYKNVWAQLTVFSQQLGKINVGQSVVLSHAEFSQITNIAYLTPSVDGSPHSLANVAVDNRSGYWPLGTLVKAQVITDIKAVSLLVPVSAVQEYEERQVVFVQHNNEYTPRPVTLGVSDGTHVEVLVGLNQGDFVVATNSYLIKADLEKSEAGHDH
jgi:cobalt-zinc-cadmium efflux system membrane fusion protein